MEVAPSSATVIIESCKKENEGSCEQLEECGGSAPLSANLENMVAGIQKSMARVDMGTRTLIDPSLTNEEMVKIWEDKLQSLKHHRDFLELRPEVTLETYFAEGRCIICEGNFPSAYTLKAYSKSASQGCLKCGLIIRIVTEYCLKYNIIPRCIRVTLTDDNRIEGLMIIFVSEEKSTLGTRDLDQCLRVFVENDHWFPECPFPKGRIVPNNPLSVPTLRLAKSWVQACIAEHVACEIVRNGLGPKRLIKIASTADRSCLRLIDAATQQQYVTLSYCWGRCTDGRLVNSTLQPYSKQIPHDALPKTVQDAILITQYLGFEYIWIDRLCINQDSSREWEEESAKMGDIYQGSLLTICAYSGGDSVEGCFKDRFHTLHLRRATVEEDMATFFHPDKDGVGYKVRVSSHYHNMPRFYPDLQPGNQRAWTYQENLLSSRRLFLHTNELLWECRHTSQCECDYMRGKPQGLFIDKGSPAGDQWSSWDGGPRLNRYRMPEDPLENLREVWARIVREYSSRLVTFSKDKLPAIQGVAKRFKKDILGSYLAGIWEAHLPAALLWNCSQGYGQRPVIIDQRNLPRGHETYRAPSWSWASYDGIVSEYPLANLNPRFAETRVLEACCTPLGMDTMGQVTAGHLIVHAPVIHFQLSKKPSPTEKFRDLKAYPLFGALHIDGFPTEWQHLFRSALDKGPGLALYTPTEEYERLSQGGTITRFGIVIIFGAKHMLAAWEQGRDSRDDRKVDRYECGFDENDRLKRYGQYSQIVGLLVRASPREEGAFQRCGIFDVDPNMHVAAFSMSAPGGFSIKDSILKHSNLEQIKLV